DPQPFLARQRQGARPFGGEIARQGRRIKLLFVKQELSVLELLDFEQLVDQQAQTSALGEDAVRKPVTLFGLKRTLTQRLGKDLDARKREPKLVRHHVGEVALLPLEDVVAHDRSEEHTSELQSRENLVCRLLL